MSSPDIDRIATDKARELSKWLVAHGLLACRDMDIEEKLTELITAASVEAIQAFLTEPQSTNQ